MARLALRCDPQTLLSEDDLVANLGKIGKAIADIARPVPPECEDRCETFTATLSLVRALPT